MVPDCIKKSCKRDWIAALDVSRTIACHSVAPKVDGAAAGAALPWTRAPRLHRRCIAPAEMGPQPSVTLPDNAGRTLNRLQMSRALPAERVPSVVSAG